jgi:hypothetical protein
MQKDKKARTVKGEKDYNRRIHKFQEYAWLLCLFVFIGPILHGLLFPSLAHTFHSMMLNHFNLKSSKAL